MGQETSWPLPFLLNDGLRFYIWFLFNVNAKTRKYKTAGKRVCWCSMLRMFFTQPAAVPYGRGRRSEISVVTCITDCSPDPRYSSHRLKGDGMEKPSLGESIRKLAVAGEQAGFTIEQMIELLTAGLGVAQLIALIDWKLNQLPIAADPASVYRWIT